MSVFGDPPPSADIIKVSLQGFYVTMLDGGRVVDIPVDHCKEESTRSPIYGDSAAILKGRTDSEIEKCRRAEGIYEAMLEEGRKTDIPVERDKRATSPEFWC